jgi:hypothetical protein
VKVKKPHHSPRRAQFHGDKILQGGVKYLWIFSMEFVSLHHSDAWNFELIFYILKNLCTAVVYVGRQPLKKVYWALETTACSAGGRAKCGVQHLMMTTAMIPL